MTGVGLAGPESGPGSAAATPPRRGFWPMRDVPAVIWLAAAIVVALVHRDLPAPRWLMIHLLLLGAVTHSIVVWSKYFADAMLHTPATADDRRKQSARLILLNVSVLLVFIGVPSDRWPLTVVGATGVGLAALWHGTALVRQLRRALPSRFGSSVRYYIGAAALLPVGAFLGATLAHGLGDPMHIRVMVAHAAINLFGWMGLTIVGTLLTLWPTMLRTRIADGAERATRRALPVLVLAVVVVATAALAGSPLVVSAGLVGYLVGLAMVARPFMIAARTRPPATFMTWSVLAGLVWLVALIAYLAVAVATAPSWEVIHERFTWITPALAVGFGAQVLLGAFSYLVPVVLGGGPTAVRAGAAVFDRAAPMRIAVTNVGLLACLLPVSSMVRVVVSMLVLASLASFVPLMFIAIRASTKARRASAASIAAGERPTRAPREDPRTARQNVRRAAVGVVAVLVAAGVGVAIDPNAISALSGTKPAAAGVAATGQTTRVTIEAANMRFTPNSISVPAGNRLIIDLKNTDTKDVHDLVLDSGADSGRLRPGTSTELDVGVVGRNLDGWCSVIGHRQMGMVMTVKVTGLPADAGATTSGQHSGEHAMPGMGSDSGSDGGSGVTASAAADLDFMAKPLSDFRAHDAALPPLTNERVHRVTLTVREVERAVAPGVTQKLWTYNGSAPGPVLHGRVGDVFDITLVNDGSIGHSIDFHAGSLAPDRPMRTIAPGASLTYRFTATRAGIWMYHCSTMPMSAHIANGMFGAVVIESPNLPSVDRSYVLVQSEYYLGPQGGVVDVAKVNADQPDAVVFNGYVNQYDTRPLSARVGQRVRVWVLDAGPNRATAFHVVGGQFDAVYSEGSYLLHRGSVGGSQALALAPSQGGFVELTFAQAGRYPFVSHYMIDAERGAHGLFAVTR